MPDEKFDEKALEKREEKTPEEKSFEEKRRRDPLGLIIWAIIFIWAGVVLLANNLGYLNWLQFQGRFFPGAEYQGATNAWSLIFLGAGVILMFEVLIRLLVPDYRRPVGGTLILALVFIGIGLGNFFGWGIIWPLIIIAIGLSLIVRALVRPS
jgi:nitric oxide reductase large subunit